MGRTFLFPFLPLLIAALVAAIIAERVVAATPTPMTASQVVARFKAATGDKLVVNKQASYPGHYSALDVGALSISKKGKYGQFTIYVITDPDLEAEVTDLLADGHTGVLGTPGRGNIYWESGTTLQGDEFWLAKRRYGTNIVLWWIGTEQKTNPAFSRLHKILTTKVVG